MPSLRIRQVPEDRIKTLSIYRHYDYDFPCEQVMREVMIRDMGREIAEKLWEHHKVLIEKKESSYTLHAKLDVIVPKEKSNAQPSQPSV